MRENEKYTVIKYVVKKVEQYSHFQAVTTNNNQHFFRIHIKQH